MSGVKKKNNPAEDLMASLLEEIGDDSDVKSDEVTEQAEDDHGDLDLDLGTKINAPAANTVNTSTRDAKSGFLLRSELTTMQGTAISEFEDKTEANYESTQIHDDGAKLNLNLLNDEKFDDDFSNFQFPDQTDEPVKAPIQEQNISLFADEPEAAAQTEAMSEPVPMSEAMADDYDSESVKTQVYGQEKPAPMVATKLSHEKFDNYKQDASADFNNDKTVAVPGFHNKPVDNFEDKVKVSIGQSRAASSNGYAAWGSGAEASLGQAENLRMAQEKILDLEKENEKLRSQNEDLISASDIIKERSDLLTAQVYEYENDKESLVESFKNETAILKGHLQRKEVELQKSQMKIDDLDSRLKFDMKKIRIRERELENRLELIRAEKNALTKSKDEQILDLRRKMDVMQMEVESYRQKCVDLNKNLEVNHDSFKRTTRALRLAMANLELQEENKPSLKKVD